MSFAHRFHFAEANQVDNIFAHIAHDDMGAEHNVLPFVHPRRAAKPVDARVLRARERAQALLKRTVQ